MKKITGLILAASLLITSIGTISVPVSAASKSLRIEAEDFIGTNEGSLAESYTDKDNSSDNSYNYVGWKQVKIADGAATDTKYTMYVDINEGDEGYYFLTSGLAANFDPETAYLSTASFTINGTGEIMVRNYSSKVMEFKRISGMYAELYEDIFKMYECRTYEPVYLKAGRNTIDFKVYDRYKNSTTFSAMFLAALDYVQFDAAVYSGDDSAKIEADTFIKMNTETIGASRIEDVNKASDDYYVRWTQVKTDKASTTFRMYADMTQAGYYTLHSGLAAYIGKGTAHISPVSFTINNTDTRYVCSADGAHQDFDCTADPYGTFYGGGYPMRDCFTKESVYLKAGRNTIDFTVYNRKNNPGMENDAAMFLALLDYIQFELTPYPIEDGAHIEAEDFLIMNEGTDGKKIDELVYASAGYYVRWTEVPTSDDSTKFTMYADAAEEGDYILHAGMAAFDKRNSMAYMSPISFTVNGTDTRYLRSADGTNIDMTTNYDADPYGLFYKELFEMRDYYTTAPVHLNKGRNVIDVTVYNRKYNPTTGNAFSSIYIAGLDYISFAKAIELENPKAVLTTNTLQKGDTAQVKVMDGTKEITLSDVYQITYKSSNENVIDVDGNGTITAKMAGTAKISVEVMAMPSSEPIALSTEMITVTDDDIYVSDFAADDSGNVSFKVVNRGDDDLSGVAIFAACYDDNKLIDVKMKSGVDIDSGANDGFDAKFDNFNNHMDVKVFVWQWSGNDIMKSLLNNVFEY